ncbi:antibiotic biosynthesis monooxygenase family protein [Nocardioides sp. GXQ0305]|uniref:antibiotic biosynthesis monooxygenase family protein n=1 Tax=Nocardioides sp. GXQ0305 TaxID=3423912 RepID=UPI003D7D5ACE
MTTPDGPVAGQVMTVFRSRLRTEGAAAYAAHAARISALARTMPGYVEHKVFTADDGERVTLVRFADRASHDAWARHPDHRVAQRAGVTDYYEEYSIAVGDVDRTHAWHREPAG